MSIFFFNSVRKDELNDSLTVIATQDNNGYDYDSTIHASHMVRNPLLSHISSQGFLHIVSKGIFLLSCFFEVWTTISNNTAF